MRRACPFPVSYTEILGEAFWLLCCWLLKCAQVLLPYFFQEKEEKPSWEEENEGRMAAFSYRVGQGVTHGCEEADRIQANTGGHSAIQCQSNSSHQLLSRIMPSVWATTHSQRGIGQQGGLLTTCVGYGVRKGLGESVLNLPQSLAPRTACVGDFALEVCWITHKHSWFYPDVYRKKAREWTRKYSIWMLKLTMKLTTLSQVHWCVDLLADLLPYMMTKGPRILNSFSSNSFIHSPPVFDFSVRVGGKYCIKGNR